MTRLLLSLSLAAFVAGGAWAQIPPPCGPHDTMLRAMKQRYGETVVVQVPTVSGSMMEVLASPKGTWTVVITNPSGVSCLMSAGTDWGDIAKPGEDS